MYLVVILVCGMVPSQITVIDKRMGEHTVVGRADMRSVDCSRYD